MTDVTLNFFVGGGTFLLFLVIHTALWHVKRKKGVLLLWSIAALTFMVCRALVQTFSIAPSLWGAGCLYAFLLIAYTRLYITLSRTLTLRFLEELLVTTGQTMTDTVWVATYPASHAFAVRLQMLEQHGWIVRKRERWSPTTKCIIVGRIIDTLRWCFGIHHAG